MLMPTKLIATGCTRPIRFDTITASDAHRTPRKSRTKDSQPKSAEPDSRKITIVPPSATSEPASARPLELLHPVRDGEQERRAAGPTAIATAPIPAGTSCSAQ